MTEFEKLTVGISTFALLVSLLAAGITIWAYEKTAASTLRFEINADFRQASIKFEKSDSDVNPVRFKRRFLLVMRNVGNAPLTVESLVITPVAPKMKNASSMPWKEALDREGPWELGNNFGSLGKTLLSQDSQPFHFPVTIEPRRVVNVQVLLNVHVAADVWKKVEKEIPLDKDLSYRDADEIFSAAGFDEWGYSFPSPPGEGSKVTPYYRYFLIVLRKEDGKELQGEFDMLGSFREQGE